MTNLFKLLFKPLVRNQFQEYDAHPGIDLLIDDNSNKLVIDDEGHTLLIS